MKTKCKRVEKTKYVFSKDNKVYIKEHDNGEKWFPINFQWIPLVKLSSELIK